MAACSSRATGRTGSSSWTRTATPTSSPRIRRERCSPRRRTSASWANDSTDSYPRTSGAGTSRWSTPGSPASRSTRPNVGRQTHDELRAPLLRDRAGAALTDRCARRTRPAAFGRPAVRRVRCLTVDRTQRGAAAGSGRARLSRPRSRDVRRRRRRAPDRDAHPVLQRRDAPPRPRAELPARRERSQVGGRRRTLAPRRRRRRRASASKARRQRAARARDRGVPRLAGRAPPRGRPRACLRVRPSGRGRPAADRRPRRDRRRGRDVGGRAAARRAERRAAARRAAPDPRPARRPARVDRKPLRRLTVRPRRRLRRGAPADVTAIELLAGDLALRILPERGLDIGEARFLGRTISWTSPLGELSWQGDFARSFGGGLLVTCGLRNVGVPSEGQPQHGWYTSLPARDVSTEHGVARARIVEAEVPGPTLELTREIRVDGYVRIRDTTRNLGRNPEPAPLLYHCNFVWDDVDIDSAEVLPRDDDARDGDWRTLGPPGPERVYEHVGASRAVVGVGDVRVTVRSSLPRLWQWIHPEYGVIGIEPANCSVLGRAHDRAEGRLPVLQPGEERVTTIEIDVEAR